MNSARRVKSVIGGHAKRDKNKNFAFYFTPTVLFTSGETQIR